MPRHEHLSPHLPYPPENGALRWWVRRLPASVPARVLGRLSRHSIASVRSEMAGQGLDVFVRREGHHYVPSYYGRSADKLWLPAERDPDFRELADAAVAEGRTRTFHDRFWILYQAIRDAARRLGEGEELTILEAGVYRGGTSGFMASVAERFAPGRCEQFAVDTFEGHSHQDFSGASDEGPQQPGVFADTSHEAVAGHLARHPFVSVLKGRLQDVAGDLGDRRFDVVNLDTDLYEPTRWALPWLAERMRPGGVLVLDNYGFDNAPGETRAADEYLQESPHAFTRLALPTGQAVLVARG